MNASDELDVRDARRIFLNQQGLLRDNQFGRGKSAVRRAIQRKSYVQIDTISIVRRAHEHVLLSRVDNFSPSMLTKLHGERAIYEYWSHAASFMPIENFRYSLPVMQGFGASRSVDRKLANRILKRIAVEGPLQSSDFEDTRQTKRNGWWDWKPAKHALEHLFLAGELMVTGRQGFQKIFDLPERVIPGDTDTSMPSLDQWADFLNLSMAKALGPATIADLGYARPFIKRLSKVDLKKHQLDSLARLTEAGRLKKVRIRSRDCYVLAELLDQLPLKLGKRKIRILSPFDNLVINRRRALELFDFNYLLECYVPEPKRRYGYFSMPVLFGDELIGRLDAKADRSNDTFIVKRLALEESAISKKRSKSGEVPESLLKAITEGIITFAAAHDCAQIRVELTEPHSLRKTLIRDLEKTI